MNLVLLGDSTIDNASYTDGGPSVNDHLRALLDGRGTVHMLALDGSMTSDIPDQLPEVPAHATHIVLSVGGNDAMMQVDVLNETSNSVSESLLTLAERTSDFDAAYRECLGRVLALDVPTTVCLIYNGAFDEASGEQTVVQTALRIYNDLILQAALDVGLNVIDLRRVCASRADYANPIEPSAAGGRKIADAILEAAKLEPRSVSTLIPSGNRSLTSI